MNYRVIVLCVSACCVALSACGHKGKLKTPSQIEQAEKKKAAKEEKNNSPDTSKEAP